PRERGGPDIDGRGAGAGAHEAGRRDEPTARELAGIASELASALAGQWTIDRCSLYKSELGRGGAVYTELERRLLRTELQASARRTGVKP
ncbi:MAG: hypothetical protein M0Z80_12855, partial [Treponema sp.]|nr:hypothetical protein [Treponema sp.]